MIQKLRHSLRESDCATISTSQEAREPPAGVLRFLVAGEMGKKKLSTNLGMGYIKRLRPIPCFLNTGSHGGYRVSVLDRMTCQRLSLHHPHKRSPESLAIDTRPPDSRPHMILRENTRQVLLPPRAKTSLAKPSLSRTNLPSRLSSWT